MKDLGLEGFSRNIRKELEGLKKRKVEMSTDNETSSSTDTTYQKWFDVKQSNGMVISELSSVKELRFAFQRASSRLFEMTSRDYYNEKMSQK